MDDGRNYLLTTRKKYDVITADIILPRHAGAGALYSREYFQLVRNALKDDGLVLQWNGAEVDTTYRLILRTFLSVFPETTLWADGTLMVGSLKPLTFSRQRIRAPLRRPASSASCSTGTSTRSSETYLAGPNRRRSVGRRRADHDRRPAERSSTSCRCRRNEAASDLDALRAHGRKKSCGRRSCRCAGRVALRPVRRRPVAGSRCAATCAPHLCTGTCAPRPAPAPRDLRTRAPVATRDLDRRSKRLRRVVEDLASVVERLLERRTIGRRAEADANGVRRVVARDGKLAAWRDDDAALARLAREVVGRPASSAAAARRAGSRARR